MEELTKKTLKWIETKLMEEIKDTRALEGGTSSLMHLLTMETREVILREYTNDEWLAEDPTVVSREAENLIEAEKIDLSTPELLAVDATGKFASRPSIIMSKITGKVELKGIDLEKLARALIKIHAVRNPEITHEYFSYSNHIEFPQANWSKYPKKWQALFTYLKENTPPKYEPVFIHRDFHPANILWENGEVSAIVDWPNACIGPREFDIAHCRWNLAMMYGLNAADTFLEAYLKHSDLKSYSSYWDLEALKNVFEEEPPAVYQGWTHFGLTELTPEIIAMRMDDFLLQASRDL